MPEHGEFQGQSRVIVRVDGDELESGRTIGTVELVSIPWSRSQEL